MLSFNGGWASPTSPTSLKTQHFLVSGWQTVSVKSYVRFCRWDTFFHNFQFCCFSQSSQYRNGCGCVLIKFYLQKQAAGRKCLQALFPEPYPSSLFNFFQVSEWVKVAQSCLTLCNPMDCPWNSPGRILERVAFPFSRGSSQPRDRIQVSRSAGGFLGERHLISQITMSSGSVFQLRLQSFPATRCPHQPWNN